MIISEQQEDYLNHLHIRIQGYRQQNDSLLRVVDSCVQGFHDADSIIYIQHSMLLSDQQFILHQADTIDTLTSVIKDQKRVIHKLRVHKGLMGVLDGVLVGIISYLLIAHG